MSSYTIDTITVKRITHISSDKIRTLVQGWKKEMYGVESDKGYHIIHMHHVDDFTPNTTYKVKRANLRGSYYNNLDFISIR